MPFAQIMAELAGNTQARDVGRPVRGVRDDELQTHRMPTMPQDLLRPSQMKGEPADSASGHTRCRRHPRSSMA
ncbi:MAG TPA: hypothetical protein VEG33_04300, partial [Streptosporangiaceae bacterium]|nr:hypothetical protein [Streptosporangiaceae bacterium]